MSSYLSSATRGENLNFIYTEYRVTQKNISTETCLYFICLPYTVEALQESTIGCQGNSMRPFEQKFCEVNTLLGCLL